MCVCVGGTEGCICMLMYVCTRCVCMRVSACVQGSLMYIIRRLNCDDTSKDKTHTHTHKHTHTHTHTHTHISVCRNIKSRNLYQNFKFLVSMASLLLKTVGREAKKRRNVPCPIYLKYGNAKQTFTSSNVAKTGSVTQIFGKIGNASFCMKCSIAPTKTYLTS